MKKRKTLFPVGLVRMDSDEFFPGASSISLEEMSEKQQRNIYIILFAKVRNKINIYIMLILYKKSA